MKVIAKEITIWIEDPLLKKMDETDIFKFAKNISSLSFIIEASPNTHKQMRVTYDPDQTSQSDLLSCIKVALKNS